MKKFFFSFSLLNEVFTFKNGAKKPKSFFHMSKSKFSGPKINISCCMPASSLFSLECQLKNFYQIFNPGFSRY